MSGAARGQRMVVGRDNELGRLHRLIEGAHAHGGALLVVGDPGIGKSTLLQAIVDSARTDNFLVLSTTGVESEAGLPYAGLYELLRPEMDGLSALPQTQREALLRAFGLEVGSQPETFLVALAALNLLAEIGGSRPVLVAVDDVQWLDEPTQAVLAFVARRVGRDVLVVVGTTRRGSAGPFHTAGLEELDVSELSEPAARALLEDRAGVLSAADREAILRAARGNPLALIELPAGWGTEDSSSMESALPLTARLERAFAGRLSELQQQTRDAVLIAATDSSDDLGEILAATSVLARSETTVDVLEGAELVGLLRFDEMRVQFCHPLVRSAVLQSETVARRQAAHASWAAVMTDPFRHTRHRAYAVTGFDEDVADELEANHRIALQRGGVSSAVWALERSAQLTSDPVRRSHRLLLAAEHAFSLGKREKVDQLLEAASQLPLSDLDRARMEWLREIFDDGLPGDAGRVFELCSWAKQSADAGDEALALNLLHAASLRCSWSGNAGPSASARIVAVLDELPQLAEDPQYVAALALAEPFFQAKRVMDRLSRIVIESVTDADALWRFGVAAHMVGDAVRSLDFLDRAESKLREQGRLGALSQVLTLELAQHVELGTWDIAESTEAEARSLALETGQSVWSGGIMVVEALTAGLRGDNERAQALAGEVEKFAASRRLNYLLTVVQLARGSGWMATGRYEEAFDAMVRIFNPADPSYHAVERFRGVTFLAEAAVRAGRSDQARTILAELGQAALITPSPTLHAQLSYARAVLADDSHAEHLYLAALDQDLVRRPWTRARIQLAYGAWLRRQRRVAESRSHLREAYSTLDAIGATAWAEEARAELRAAGERTTEHAASGHDTLSPQEMQIARLVADGLSNREIGERLFLSHRTVGSHLYRIFPKLGITSRGQLAARLSSV